MPADWRSVRLGDVTEWASGGTPPKQSLEYWGGDIPWISARSMKSGLLVESERTLTEEGLARGSRRVDKGTVLILVRGSELHRRIPVGIAGTSLAFNQDVKALTAKQGLNNTYLYYWLLANESLLLSKVEYTGIGAGKLDTGVLQQLVIELPPKFEQDAIASVVGALDDKIELNRRMSETLEEIADAVFQSWFVDFDEAEELEASGVGLIPRGWSVGPVGNWVEVSGGATPSTKEPDFWQGGTIPWATPKDLSGHGAPVLLDTARHITPMGLARISSGLLPQGTLLFSSRAPIGYTAIAGQPMAVNQGFIAIPPGGELSPTYMYFWCRTNLDHIKGHAGGSTFAEISKRAFRQIPALLPPAELRDRFDVFAEGILDRATLAQKETMTLIKLRDALLPKLISGELRIPDAEKLVSEVT